MTVVVWIHKGRGCLEIKFSRIESTQDGTEERPYEAIARRHPSPETSPASPLFLAFQSPEL